MTTPAGGRMHNVWVRFGREVDGQDLLEYTFLLAAILLASVALMMNVAPGASAIWAQTAVTLNQERGGPAEAGSTVSYRKLSAASPPTAAVNTAEMVVA